MKKNKKIAVGFIVYGEVTVKYLPYFLPSLLAQTEKNFFVLVFDNTEKEKNNSNIKYINRYCPQAKIFSVNRNIGFACAYNHLIKAAAKQGADYFFVINPDVVLSFNVLAELAKALENNLELAAVSPKVLRWDFLNKKKTNIIDTCGIILRPGLRFQDVGQTETDKGQYDNASIIGPSGAAGMYRLSALEAIKEHGQYFDEKFFMYKEDCDLAYRLYLAGFKAKCVPRAIVYHDRTVSQSGKYFWSTIFGRRQKARQVKEWSFFGQQFIFFKYWPRQSWRQKLAVLSQELKMVIFVLFFEPYLLKEIWRAWQASKENL